MNFVRLLPPIISLLLLSAHFSKLNMMLLSFIFIGLPFLLFIKKKWSARIIYILLIIGSLEWIRTIFHYVNQRQSVGEPYFRLIIIIGVVAIFTAFSTLVFRNSKLKERYNIQ